jgi:hypothetical protein
MPVGFGKTAIKTKGRPLSVMAHLKRSIVEVRAEQNCLVHALIISIAKLTNDPNYIAYRKGYKILPVVQRLLETTGIDLQNGGGITNPLDSGPLQRSSYYCSWRIRLRRYNFCRTYSGQVVFRS